MPVTLPPKQSGSNPPPTEDLKPTPPPNPPAPAPKANPMAKVFGGTGELAKVLKAIEKQKGEGLIMPASKVPQVARIPTGVFEFDLATGGGFPMSRLSIIYGPESSGKSNICYHAAREAQKLPESCNKVVWVDLEGTFDPIWVAQFGVDVDQLIIVKPGYGEEAVDIIDALIRADDVALVVLDSVAVVTSAKEAEQSTEKFDVGTAAVLMKRLSNKLALAFSLEARRGHTPAMIFINQTRFKIGVMFGDPETMPGGQTMKFLSSLTVRLYGKNKIEKTIHPEKVAFKETVGVVKKAKVAVNSASMKYDMAMMETPTLSVGQTDSWSLVAGYLRDSGTIRKADKGGGWQVQTDKLIEYSTLAQIQDQYLTDESFRLTLQKLVIQQVAGNGFLVEAEGLAAK